MIRKKKNKDGSIKFEARVNLNGKALYQRFDAYKEAESWVNSVRYRRDGGSSLPITRVTPQMLLAGYKEHATAKGRSPATLFKAEENFRLHISPFYGSEDMRTVTIEEHEKFLSSLLKKSLKPATINRIRSLLAVMFSVAKKKRLFHGAIQANPFECVEPLSEIKPPMNYWSFEEVNRFLESVKGSFYYPMWITWLNTGLRIGELVTLTRSQVDTQAHLIRVDRTWCNTIKGIRMVTKGKKVRHVGLNRITQQVLYPSLKKEGFVFAKEDGTVLTHAFIRQYLLPRACKQAGVREMNPHGIRHSFSGLYMMHGGNLWDLQKILGHSDIKTTEEYYAHFSVEHIQKRANVISLGNNVVEVDFKKGVVA